MLIKRFQALSAPARAAALACMAAVVVWSAVWIAPDVDEEAAAPREQVLQVSPPRTEPTLPRRESAQGLPSVKSVPARPRATPAAATAPTGARDPRVELREALTSDNAGTRIDALRTAAELRTVQALPDLFAIDIVREPEIAPTVFQVTGRLAEHADASQRAAAISQLSSWLDRERARPGADARGNVSVLVETLADFQAPEAEGALIGVLQDLQQPLHVKTLAVEGLGKLSSPAAQAAIERFRADLGQSTRQGFELTLQREAEQAADRALARLSR